MKKFVLGVLALSMAVSCFSGCQNGNEAKTGTNVPTISWYVRPVQQDDEAVVFKKVSEVVEKNIGAKLAIKRIEPGSYEEKLKLAISSGEKFDLCHTAVRYNYYNYATKGAFLDITELLPKYAPKTYGLVSEDMWNATKVNGKIYGSINYQIIARRHGFVVQKELADKYKFDITSVKKFEDIEPFLESLQQNEDSRIVPFDNYRMGPYGFAMQHYLGFDNIGDVLEPGVVGINDESLTVFNQFESQSFKDYIELMRKWYLNGYIKKDAATVTNAGELRKQGYSASVFDMIGPGFESSFKELMGGREVQTVIIDPEFIRNDSILSTLTAVNKNSQNPQLAIQVIEMLNTNQDDVYNILNFGIEGKHFNKISDQRIEPIKGSGYYPNCAWMYGNQFNAYLVPGQSDDVWEETKNLNSGAARSKLLGFNYDVSPIATEVAQCQAVTNEYLPLLCTGSVDTAVTYEQFISKLKSAGSDKIIVEKQAQINEWKNMR